MRKSIDKLPKARKGRKPGRRSPLASIALILIGLVATGGAYALFTTTATRLHDDLQQRNCDRGFEALPGQLRHLPRHEPRGHQAGPVASRRRRGIRAVPGLDRPDARRGIRTAGRREDPAVHRPADARARRVRRLEGGRPGDPVEAVPRGHRQRGEGCGALPHQLRHVPQRGRRRRCTHRGQVRASAERRLGPAHLRGHGHRPAEHARVQRPEHHAARRRPTSSPTSSTSTRTRRPVDSTSATWGRCPRGSSSGSSVSAQSSESRSG